MRMREAVTGCVSIRASGLAGHVAEEPFGSSVEDESHG